MPMQKSQANSLQSSSKKFEKENSEKNMRGSSGMGMSNDKGQNIIHADGNTKIP